MSICRKIIPKYQCNPDDVLLCQKRMRDMNWFCSDIQVRGYYPCYAKRFFEENNIQIVKDSGDDKILRDGKLISIPSATI